MKAEQLTLFFISPDNTVVEAMQKIDRNARGILFVVNEQQKLLGVITDGDIRRWLIRTGELKAAVAKVMNINPQSITRKEQGLAKEFMMRQKITALPILTTKGIISDILFSDAENVTEKVSEGLLKDVPIVIMAGGKGTRLYPYTKILPKPLIPIGDIPIMERIIGKFLDYGVQNFYATVNYRKNMIKSYFSELNANYNICYVEEDKPLGTAGSLKLIKDDFSEPFIVTNCDILIHADYEDIYRYHKESGNELTIVSALKNIVVPYGVIHSKENGTVISMEEKPKLSYFVNTGMYQKHLASFVERKAMTMKTKCTILTTVTIIMAFAFVMMKNVLIGRICLVVVWIFHILYFFLRVGTIKENEKKEVTYD